MSHVLLGDISRAVAACCSVLQCVVVCCSVLQCVAVCCSVLQCLAVSCSVLQCLAVSCSVSHYSTEDRERASVVYCDTLRYIATLCNTLQHAKTCNTLQHPDLKRRRGGERGAALQLPVIVARCFSSHITSALLQKCPLFAGLFCTRAIFLQSPIFAGILLPKSPFVCGLSCILYCNGTPCSQVTVHRVPKTRLSTFTLFAVFSRIA